MLILSSPSKTQNFTDQVPARHSTVPLFLAEAGEIARKIKTWRPAQIAARMHISANLAAQVADKTARWTGAATAGKPALLAYKGDVYRGMHPEDYTAAEQDYAQRSVRILTGLYGVLRGYDRFEAYRLEMKIRVKIGKTDNLADYWRPKVTRLLQEEIEAGGHRVVVNVASVEYADAVDFAALPVPTVHPRFLTRKGKVDTLIAIHAKRARGLMMEHLIRRQAEDRQAVESFTTEGWRFDRWDGDIPIFIREGNGS
jgi:cytoplasmic iron level regulating protein YaaA (DUF328/UPF0246 family)